jgi:hypothetical protein
VIDLKLLIALVFPDLSLVIRGMTVTALHQNLQGTYSCDIIKLNNLRRALGWAYKIFSIDKLSGSYALHKAILAQRVYYRRNFVKLRQTRAFGRNLHCIIIRMTEDRFIHSSKFAFTEAELPRTALKTEMLPTFFHHRDC